MKAPDKIYVPEGGIALENGVYGSWRLSDEHDMQYAEYIRKDALLEWANEQKKDISEFQQKYPQDNDWYDGESFILDELISKLQEL